MALRRAMLCSLAAVVAACSCGLVQAQPAAPTDVQKFAGPWTVTAAELAGEPATELVGSVFEFKGEMARFIQKTEAGEPVADDHPFKLDEKTHRMLVYQEAGKPEGMQRGIYRFGNAALYLCLTAPDATEFPTEFTSKPELLMLKLERSTGGPKAAAAPAAAPR